MTTFAGCGYMSPSEWKAGLAMVETVDAPGDVAMAIVTSRCGLTLMFVILLVAAVAVKRCFAEALQVFVAGGALDCGLGVRIAQREFGFFVFEASGRRLPVVFQMAIGAFFAQRQLMFVVFFMASVAVRRRFFIQLALVTVFALHFFVLAKQREFALVVVKLAGLLPAAF